MSCLTFPLENLPASGVSGTFGHVNIFHLYVLAQGSSAKTVYNTHMCGWFLGIVMKIIGLNRCCAPPNPNVLITRQNATGMVVPTIDFEATLLPRPATSRASSSTDAKSKALPAPPHHPKRTQPEPAPHATDHPARPHPPKSKRPTPPNIHVFGFSTQREPGQPPTKALKKLPPPTPHEPSPPPELARSKFHTGLARVQEGWQITKQTGQSDAGYAMILEGLDIMLEDDRIDHSAKLRVMIGEQMTQVEQLKERMDALASGPSTELGDGTGNAPEVSPQAPHIAKASALAAEPAPTTSPLPPSPDQLKRAATDPSPHTLAPVSPTDHGPSTGLDDGTGQSTIRVVVDRVKAEEPAPSVPGSVPEQPAMEVDEPGSLVQKLIIDPVDPATPADESEADFGGDQDEVEPETVQDS